MQNYMRQMNEQIRASREEIRNLRNRNASESKIRETQEKYRNRINEIRTEMNELASNRKGCEPVMNFAYSYPSNNPLSDQYSSCIADSIRTVIR